MPGPGDSVWEDAWLRRDPAFDGRFFVGVRTTGVYCRCVCPVRLPLRRNVEFLPSAAAAEDAGFRPCLRCRPETAPFCPAWKGTLTTAERAARLIEGGALDGEDASVERLAARLGITARHLSRVFVRHWDATPSAMARTARVQRAKRLLSDTALPMTEVAAQAGFGSLRRFNAVFADVYKRPPGAIRRGVVAMDLPRNFLSSCTTRVDAERRCLVTSSQLCLRTRINTPEFGLSQGRRAVEAREDRVPPGS